MKKCFIISAVFKKQKTFVHQEIRQPNRAQNFRRLAQVKRHVLNRSETSRSVSWILKLGGSLLFFFFARYFGCWKEFLSHGRLAEYSDLHLTLIQQCKMIYSFVDISLHLSFIYIRSMQVSIFKVSIWSQTIADRRSQKVLRSCAIIWKHTSAIACDPAIVIADDRRR